jgi:hypothetical protein
VSHLVTSDEGMLQGLTCQAHQSSPFSLSSSMRLSSSSGVSSRGGKLQRPRFQLGAWELWQWRRLRWSSTAVGVEEVGGGRHARCWTLIDEGLACKFKLKVADKERSPRWHWPQRMELQALAVLLGNPATPPEDMSSHLHAWTRCLGTLPPPPSVSSTPATIGAPPPQLDVQPPKIPNPLLDAPSEEEGW